MLRTGRLALLLALTAGCAGGSELPPPTPKIAQSTQGGITPLTSAQIQTAKSIIARDTTMAAIIRGQQPASYMVDTWTHMKDNGLIGAVARITLPVPVTYKGALPTIAYDRSEKTLPYYRTDLIRWSITGATTLVISVDLNTRRVAGIHFGPEAEVESLDPLPVTEGTGE